MSKPTSLKRKVISILLLLALLLPIAGCGTSGGSKSDEKTVSKDSVYFSAEEIAAIYDAKEDEDFYINQIIGDENGVAVLMNVYKYSETDEEDSYDYNQIVLLDNTGAIINTISLEEYLEEGTWANAIIKNKDGGYSVITDAPFTGMMNNGGSILMYTMDKDGNMAEDATTIDIGKDRSAGTVFIGENGYIYVKGYLSSGSMFADFVAVFDIDGKELLYVESDYSSPEQISLGQSIFTDGTDVYIDINKYSDTGFEYLFCKIDPAEGKLGEPFSIAGISSAMTNSTVQSGDGNALLSNDVGVYKLDMQKKELTPSFLWKDLDVDISADEVTSIMLDEETIFVKTQSWNFDGMAEDQTRYYLLKKANENPNAGKIIVRVGGISISWDKSLKSAVYEFNQKSKTHRMEIYDYDNSEEMYDYSKIISQMNLDIISGTAPDIIIGSSALSMDAYISKGVLADLNTFLENDPDIKREDFIENVLALKETDGKLYELYSSFSLTGLIGAKSLIGDRTGWTVDEFVEMVNGLPENMKPMQGIDYDSLLQMACIASGNQFVNWATGEVSFESDEFIQLLNYAKTYGVPADDQGMGMMGRSIEIDGNEAIKNKELAMIQTFGMTTLSTFASYRETFGEPITIVGFPSANKSGPSCYTQMSFSISEKSESKDAAWEFIKFFLSEDSQDKLAGNYSGLPVLRASMDKLIEKEKKPKENTGGVAFMDSSGFTYSMEYAPLTQEGAETFLEIVEDLNTGVSFDQSISDIISTEADAFFKGSKSDIETARIIQERVQTAVNEKS